MRAILLIPLLLTLATQAGAQEANATQEVAETNATQEATETKPADESSNEDCDAVEAVVLAGVGAGVGAVAATASVWTLAVLAAPFTLGGSIGIAVATTLPAIALGAQGGAFYGASFEAVQCGRKTVEYFNEKYPRDDAK